MICIRELVKYIGPLVKPTLATSVKANHMDTEHVFTPIKRNTLDNSDLAYEKASAPTPVIS